MAVYNLNNKVQLARFNNRVSSLKSKKGIVDLKEVKQTRSAKQNNALHLYFEFISDALNDLDLEFQYESIRGKHFSLRYTPKLVKEFIWKPIQIALYDIESTTKINTTHINRIIDVLTKFFADQGLTLEFPSLDNLLIEEYNKQNY